ncbi:MAG: glycosyltransferase family 4 protein [Acidobacteria bacterium]|nr:glycosyltransferase family 4 protein [Acidobacteriota bacterium]
MGVKTRSDGARLRVGIDGRAFASPAPGIRRYVAGLVRGLLALGEPIDVVALGGRDSSALPPGTGHVDEPPHPPTNLGWTLVGIPRAARRAAVDVIHAPAYTAPFWSPVPTVLTIHDVSYELHPQWYPYRRDWMRRTFYRRSAHAASHILTVSAFSASEISAAYHIPRERITVAPLGVDETFRPDEPGPPGEIPAGVMAPFLLHVGDLHERRNLPMLVEAVLAARRRSEARPAISLVLVGTDRGAGGALRALAAQAGAPEAVVPLASVGDRQLRALYRHATALVYPSLYEGFGLPLLEAMASGTPVVASRAASIPEVVGDGGLLLDPVERDAWTRAIVDIVNDGARRVRMREAGLRRAAQFTWARTARMTLDVYRRVA